LEASGVARSPEALDDDVVAFLACRPTASSSILPPGCGERFTAAGRNSGAIPFEMTSAGAVSPRRRCSASDASLGTPPLYPATDKQAEYGSMFPMEWDLFRAELTQQHVAALRSILQHYNGPE
jgi:hypothetical protein